MRERGFLNEAIDQQIIWVVQKDLKAKMQGKCPEFSSGVIHTWCLKNEVRAKKMGIVMAAFQDITFKIEQLGMLSHEDTRQSILQHAEGFREHPTPQATWGSERKMEKTNLVLWQFAEKSYDRFGFPIPFDQNTILKEAIAQTIAGVHQKISDIFIDFHKNAVSEMHQKCVVKKQMRTIQYQHSPTDALPEPVVKHQKIKDKDYPSAMKNHATPIREVFKTPHLTENFYIESNQLSTAQQNGVHLKESFLKTIDFILVVVRDEGVWVAEAISNDMLPKYIKHLQQHPTDNAIQHQVFIIRADGVLYHRGTGTLAPSQTTIDDIMCSQWMQDVLIDTALLKGKILYNERFNERVSRWPDFLEFWNKILTALPLKKEISVNALRSYLPSELAGELNC